MPKKLTSTISPQIRKLIILLSNGKTLPEATKELGLNRRHKNNHARTKRRVKVLHLKMFFRRVMDNRHKKIMKAHTNPGTTIVGQLKSYAEYIPPIVVKEKKGRTIVEHTVNYKLVGRLNQRKKRKLWRQAPYMRIKRA